MALLVDEFHALPAADYAALLAELAKYGVSLTLATQTLGALVGPSGDHHLFDAVFGNTDHLFAFNCAATDAKVLAPELGAPLEPADLVELGDFQCYARLSHRGERLPAFSLRLDPPPPGDPVVRWTAIAPPPSSAPTALSRHCTSCFSRIKRRDLSRSALWPWTRSSRRAQTNY